MGDVKTPSQVAKELEISPSTLRKYSLLLEENGVEFKRNAKNSRQFTDDDVITLRKFIALVKTDGMTVEDAAYAVSSSFFNKSRTDESSVTENGIGRHDDDMTVVIVSEVKALKEVIKQQQETIDKFRITQEERDQLFVEVLENLQEEVKALKEQTALPAPDPELTEEVSDLKEEVQRLNEVAAAKEKSEGKKGFFARLFK